MTNRDLLKMWENDLEMIGRTEGTIRTYRNDFGLFLDFIGEKDLAKVTKDDIKNFLRFKKEEGNSSSTIDKLYAIVSSFFFWAEDEGYVPTHPMPTWRNRPKIKWGNKKIRYLNEKEKEAVHKYFASQKDPRDTMIYNFMLGTGARVSDVRFAKIEDISWKDPSIGFFGKGEKFRYVPMGENLAKALKQYLEDEEFRTGYIFRNRWGKPLSQSYFNWTFDKARDATRIKELTPHVVRHTYATDFLKSGGKLEDLKEILGHVSINTTMIYAKILREDLLKAVKMHAPEVFVK